MRSLTLVISTLAAYLALVHTLAFAGGMLYARLASLAAILILDLLILGLVMSHPRSLMAVTVVLASLPVAGLHANYVYARYLGAEHGLFGEPLATTKNLIVLSQLVLIGIIAVRRWRVARPWQEMFRIDRADFVIVTIVLVPLVNYFARNIADFGVTSAAAYFLTLFAIPVAAFSAVQLFQRTIDAPALAAPLVAGLCFAHYSMPMASQLLRRPVEFLFPFQFAFAVGVAGLLMVVYRVHRQALVMAVMVFTIGSAAGSLVMAAGFGDSTGRASNAAPTGIDDALARRLDGPLARHASVYLLIYDSYAPASVMEAYGIDNAAVDALLMRHGFTDYEDVYSLYHASYPSMSGVMNMGTASAAGIAGPALATNFFKSHAYRTELVLNSYLLRTSMPVAVDETFPAGQSVSGLRALYRGIAGGEFKAETVFDDVPRDAWVAAKRAILSAPGRGPRLVYAHSGRPGHSQNSGHCLPDETERYRRRLEEANLEMAEDLDAVLTADPNAIVIVAGDHGPYLTGDCLYLSRTPVDEITAAHLADRYGVRLAIRWPEGSAPGDVRPGTLQEVLLAAAAYLLDDPAVMASGPVRRTMGFGGIPDHAVQDGIVRVGRDAGQTLFPSRR